MSSSNVTTPDATLEAAATFLTASFSAASIGFKEWALVCAALGAGRQSLILRKGGIAEGRDGFRFKHDQFLLFPSLFHEQTGKLTLAPGTAVPAPRGDRRIEITFGASVVWTREICEWEMVQRLEPFHCWQREEIERRFRYDEHPGVSLAFIRVYQLSAPFIFDDSPKFGGCRSWVSLPGLPVGMTAWPVLRDEEHAAREAEILAALR